MGEFNSSVTRVWPVFDYLFKQDATGKSWLGPLLRLGSLSKMRGPLADSDLGGSLLSDLAKFDLDPTGPLARALGHEQCVRLGRIRNAYEKELAPPERFLRWMIDHSKQLTWPKTASGSEETFGDATQKKAEASACWRVIDLGRSFERIGTSWRNELPAQVVGLRRFYVG